MFGRLLFYTFLLRRPIFRCYVRCGAGIQPESSLPSDQLESHHVDRLWQIPLAIGRFLASLYSFATLRKELGGKKFQKGPKRMNWETRALPRDFMTYATLSDLITSISFFYPSHDFPSRRFLSMPCGRGKIAKITQEEDEAFTETCLGMVKKKNPGDSLPVDTRIWTFWHHPGLKMMCFFFLTIVGKL